MKKASSFLTVIVTCFLAFSAGGCVEAFAASSSVVVLQSSPKINTTAFYIYNPAGKPDPFQPFIEREIFNKKKKEKEKLQALPLSPLQRASLDQFKLVGIAGDDKRMMAVVEYPKGKFYPLFQGTRIGQSNGVVVKILPDRIIVEEKVKTGGGKKTDVKKITIRLQREEDEVRP